MASADHKTTKGVHRVKKRSKAGEREYHYAYRGGSRFWASDSGVAIGSPEYLAALAGARSDARAVIAPPTDTIAGLVASYRASTDFRMLADRTQQDYGKYLTSIEDDFGSDEAVMFEVAQAIGEIDAWKAQWAHSPRQYDYATFMITRLLNYAQSKGLIAGHTHHGVKRLYKVDRAEIVWRPHEVEALVAVGTERERRIAVMLEQTGLPPQDLAILTRDHVEDAPAGRRIVLRRLKSGVLVTIPVSKPMAAVIDTTPDDEKTILVSLTGQPLTPLRLSAIVHEMADRARAQKPGCIRTELRPYDLRGTRATLLLRAECSYGQIAACMGWSERYAARMIEIYTRIVPEFTDGVQEKLDAFLVRQVRGRG